MKFEEVRACLERDGWPVDVVSATTFRTRFRGKDRVFHLFIHADDVFVIFAVIPFARLPEEEADADALVARLLRLNREMNMAKFSVDEDGDVILSVEYRLGDLDPSEVRDALDVLSFYADRYRSEVATTEPAPAAK